MINKKSSLEGNISYLSAGGKSRGIKKFVLALFKSSFECTSDFSIFKSNTELLNHTSWFVGVTKNNQLECDSYIMSHITKRSTE